ncbi:MAG: c-type cytochrome [Candidatus Acidiferrales bacterium]
MRKIDQPIEGPFSNRSRKASFFAGLAPASLSLALLALLLCFSAGTSRARQEHDDSAKQASADSALDAGKKLFGSNCAGCHGLDARGGEHAPNIATNPDIQRMSDDQLFHIVHHGAAGMAMPAFGGILSNGEIKSVVAYLRSLQGVSGGAQIELPGDPAAGRSLFFGKAACSQCHALAGSGGFIASDLTTYAAPHTPAEIARAITNPNDDLNPRSRTAIVVTRGGQKLTGFIRNQDNFSIQFQSLDGTFHLLQRSGVASVTYNSQSLMPADYSQRLSAAELNDLVSLLMRAAAANTDYAHENKKGHDEDDDGDH